MVLRFLHSRHHNYSRANGLVDVQHEHSFALQCLKSCFLSVLTVSRWLMKAFVRVWMDTKHCVVFQISGLNMMYVCRTSCCSAMTATEATTCTVSVLPWLNRQRVSWQTYIPNMVTLYWSIPLCPGSSSWHPQPLWSLLCCLILWLCITLCCRNIWSFFASLPMCFTWLSLHHVTRLPITHCIYGI